MKLRSILCRGIGVLALLDMALVPSLLQAAPAPGATVTFDLETATLEDLQLAMNSGALTSVELVALYKARIAAYDQTGPNFNAVPALNPDVEADAAAADARRAAGGRGLLLGVPFVVKGSIGVKNMALTNGLDAWVNLVPSFDSWLVAKLREAGAVFLGHANLDAFQSSAGSSNSQNWGVVRNAYIPFTTSGGSSGGPGAATGANLAFFAIGCETGGSIRGPSDRAGLVGIKPSNGVVSVMGLAPLAADRDQPGPMTRYALDNAAVLDIVSQPDPQDIWTLVELAPGRARPSGFLEKAKAATLAGKKVGILRNNLALTGGVPTTTGIAGEINTFLSEAKAAMEAAGATVEEITLPIKEGASTTYMEITYTGRRDSVPPEIVTPPRRALYNPVTSDTTGNMLPDARAYGFEHLIESIVTSPTDPDRVTKIMEWITPVSQISAAMKASIQNQTTYDFSNPVAQEHFQAVRYQIADWEAWLAGLGVDVVIFPTSTSKTVGTNPNGVGGGNTSPGRTQINSFSLPFVTCPMGVLSTGEPITIGFLGSKYWSDAETVGFAAAYEKISNKRIVSPLAPPLEGEHFEYVVPFPPAVAVHDRTPPTASMSKGTEIKGSGKKLKLKFGGKAGDNAALASVKVTVNGKRVPAKLTRDGWAAEIGGAFLRKLAKKGVKKVKVVVIVRDSSGNTVATKKALKIPAKIIT